MSGDSFGDIRFAFLDEPPFCWPDPAGGEPGGSDVDLARSLLQAVGARRIIWVLAEFAELLPGLVEGRWDMTTGLFVTEERQRLVRFGRPIWSLVDGLLVRAGNPRRLTGYESIAADPVARLGVIADQVQERTGRAAGIPDARIVIFATQDEAASAVRDGQVEAYASVALAHRGYLQQRGAEGLEVVEIRSGAGAASADGAFAFAPERADLLAAVEGELDRRRWAI